MDSPSPVAKLLSSVKIYLGPEKGDPGSLHNPHKNRDPYHQEHFAGCPASLGSHPVVDVQHTQRNVGNSQGCGASLC